MVPCRSFIAKYRVTFISVSFIYDNACRWTDIPEKLMANDVIARDERPERRAVFDKILVADPISTKDIRNK